MARRKGIPVAGRVRINTYAVIERAVEEGIEFGWGRAHKHTDTPTPEHVREAVHIAVMNELSDLLRFDGDAS